MLACHFSVKIIHCDMSYFVLPLLIDYLINNTTVVFICMQKMPQNLKKNLVLCLSSQVLATLEWHCTDPYHSDSNMRSLCLNTYACLKMTYDGWGKLCYGWENIVPIFCNRQIVCLKKSSCLWRKHFIFIIRTECVQFAQGLLSK